MEALRTAADILVENIIDWGVDKSSAAGQGRLSGVGGHGSAQSRRKRGESYERDRQQQADSKAKRAGHGSPLRLKSAADDVEFKINRVGHADHPVKS